jgi:hypothetical protein
MRTLAPATLIALSVVMAACRSEPAPTVEWRDHVFEEVQSLGDLPPVIQSGLGASRSGLDGIADRGQRFNATDAVVGTWPMRRFLVAGRDRETWLVALEHGGRGYYVEVFLFSQPEPTPKHKWVLLQRPRTLRDVVQQVSQKDAQ